MSLYVYASSDNSWNVQGESGFSGAYVGPLTVEGFQADLNADSRRGTGWYESVNWRISGQSSSVATLFRNGNSFNTANGRYTAPVDGTYLVSMNARVDAAASGYIRLVSSINSGRNYNGGLHSLDGNPSDGTETMSVAGIVMLKKGDYISQFLYSCCDNSWYLQHESGFSVTLLHDQSGSVGFMADLSASPLYGRGWFKPTSYNTHGSSSSRLFNSGHFDDITGTFRAPLAGIYFVAANYRFDSACGVYFRVQVAINGNTDNNNGLMAIDGGPACDYASFNVEGMMWLEENDRVEVWVYSDSDNSWYTNTESGWGVTLIS